MSPSDREEVEVRPLATHAEYAACLALQRETWGAEFADAVPPSILQVAQKVGGVAAGAFDARGRLVGFVFGLTGVRHGVVAHWSDMLAVRPEARNLGIGRKLKEFQRAALAGIDGRVIYWTYDPLVARNAHLNFNVFGVRVDEYVRDMYGEHTGSTLHRGIGTDRLIVAWLVRDAELAARRRIVGAAHADSRYDVTPVLGDAERDQPLRELPERLRIAVPLDIATLQQSDPKLAARWRASTRAAFEQTLGDFDVAGFRLASDQGRGFYLLARRTA